MSEALRDLAAEVAMMADTNHTLIGAGARAVRETLLSLSDSVAAVETLLLSELFLPIDVADSLWSLEVEDKIIADVKKFVG